MLTLKILTTKFKSQDLLSRLFSDLSHYSSRLYYSEILMMISFPQKQERSTANTEPLSASQEKPQMTLLCFEEKERETSPTLVTWVTSRCVSNDAARTRNATWPLNLQKRVFLSIALVKNRAKPHPPLTTYLVHECVL